MRKSKGLTQTKVSELIGVTTRHYQSLEAGTSRGSMKVWQKFQKLYGKPIDFLIAQEEVSQNEQKSG